MANSKKLIKAAIKFRKTEPELHALCSHAIDRIADFIRNSSATEVTAEVYGRRVEKVYENK